MRCNPRRQRRKQGFTTWTSVVIREDTIIPLRPWPAVRQKRGGLRSPIGVWWCRRYAKGWLPYAECATVKFLPQRALLLRGAALVKVFGSVPCSAVQSGVVLPPRLFCLRWWGAPCLEPALAFLLARVL